MKPIIILPPDTMEPAEIQALRDNGLCVVVAKDPARVKFLDPIPSMAGRGKVEQAAIQFSRKILDRNFWISNGNWTNRNRSDVVTTFIDVLVKGTPLDADMDMYENIFGQEKAEEVRRLARAEAKAEREAAKKAAKGAK